jgi:hypothetical protein
MVVFAGVISELSFGCGTDHAPFIDLDAPEVDGGGAPSGVAEAGNGGAAEGNVKPDPGEPSFSDLSELDPDEVYLFGTLVEGQLGVDALAHWREPNVYTVGFDGSVSARFIKLWQGQLVYTLFNGQGIRISIPELQSSLKPIDLKYPAEPLKDDPIVSTPPCPAEGHGPQVFATSPDGRLIYRCPDLDWYEDGTKVWVSGDDGPEPILSFGYDGVLLLAGPSLMSLEDGEPHPIQGLGSSKVLTARASMGGFHVVLTPEMGGDTAELWSVTPEGGAERIASYEPSPAGATDFGRAVLAGNDDLFQLARSEPYDIVVRRSRDGESEVVYTEADDPRVKMHGSTIFTGP